MKNQNFSKQLEMDYQEASLIFSSETLNAMQMVQVNGGGFLTEFTKYFGPAVTTKFVSDLYDSVVNWIKSNTGTTPNENSVTVNPRTGEFKVTGTGNEIIIDSITPGGIYNIRITPIPTPINNAPTSSGN